MTGHVFHPGHDDLHGVTVVVESRSGLTYVGRYHEQSERGVVMHDAAVHDSASSVLSRSAWLARLAKYGIQIEHRTLVVPNPDLLSVTRLTEALLAP